MKFERSNHTRLESILATTVTEINEIDIIYTDITSNNLFDHTEWRRFAELPQLNPETEY